MVSLSPEVGEKKTLVKLNNFEYIVRLHYVK